MQLEEKENGGADASEKPHSRVESGNQGGEASSRCPGSLWNVVTIQFQNAFLDKIVQYLLAGLAFVLPATQISNEQRENYPHLGALLLALPSIFMSPLAGWLADRYSKRDILLWCSVVQLVMLAGTALVLYLDLFWVSTVVFFFLGLQATLLMPAKGGIVKELVGERHLTYANSWINATGLIAITLGPWFGGLLVRKFYPDNPQQPNLAMVTPALLLTGLAAISVICAWRIPRTEMVGGAGKFHRALLWEHFGNLAELLRIRRLRLPAFGVSFFWFAATMLALMLFQGAAVLLPGMKELQSQEAGLLLVWVGVGIAVGSALVSLVSVERIELGLIPIGGLGMAIFSVLAAMPFVELDSWWFRLLLAGIGASSGVFLVPLSAYLQDLVDPATRGRQLGAASLLDSLAMLVAILTQVACSRLLPGIHGVRLQFLFFGLCCLGAAIYVVRIIPQNFFRFVLLSLVKIIYRVKVNHGQRIPEKGGVLLLANHVSYIDAFVVSAACDRKVRFIANDQFHRMPFIGWFLKMFDVVPVAPTRAKEAIVTLAEELKKGHVVCMFPEGQLTRTGFVNEIRKGFELIAKRSGCPVIPVYMDDLWGSIFSFERGIFLRKWPNHFAYRVNVLVGEPMPAASVSAAKVRDTFRNLATEAVNERGELRPRVEEAVAKALARHPWKLGWIGRQKATRGHLLAYAQLLARRWTDRVQSQRVGVIAAGENSLLANLALRMAGFTPVNIRLADEDLLEDALKKHQISTLLVDDLEDAPTGVSWLSVLELPKEIAKVDNLLLGLAILLTYVVPKSFHAALVRRRRRDELASQEAVGWLADSTLGVRYHSLTHRQLLAQSEQLRSVDSCREGETVCSPHGHACIEGTVLGFWNALLSGATLCASIRHAQVIVTNRLAWKALAETGLEAPLARAIFLCGDVEDLSDLAALPQPAARPSEDPYSSKPAQQTPLLPCLVPTSMERFVTMSLPHPTIPTSTADHQDGWKPQTLGRLLPGYRMESLPAGGLKLVGPDDSQLELLGAELDSEDFLKIVPPAKNSG